MEKLGIENLHCMLINPENLPPEFDSTISLDRTHQKNCDYLIITNNTKQYFDFKTFPLNALNYCTQSRAMSKKKITIQYTKVQRTNKKHQPRGDCDSLIMKKVQYQNCYTSCSAFFDLYQKRGIRYKRVKTKKRES